MCFTSLYIAATPVCEVHFDFRIYYLLSVYATIINNVKTSMFCSVLNLSCFVPSRRKAEVKLPSENTSNEAQKNRGLRNLLPFMV